jgi:diguanylate cyclase (GGDEF)-like protein
VNVDGLTQVANRRCFNNFLEQEWRRLTREQQPLSLILCDVDYFKRFNDYYGHLKGDDCLRQVAAAIKTAVKRPADLVARYGGEEFAIVLPNTDLKGAIAVAEAVRTMLQQSQISHAGSESEKIITLSLGIASLIPQIDIESKSLIAIADQALYEAKKQGRDRLCYFPAPAANV